MISLQKNYGLDQLDALPDGMRVETPAEFLAARLAHGVAPTFKTVVYP